MAAAMAVSISSVLTSPPMPPAHLTRRSFLTLAATVAGAHGLSGQVATARINVAEAERSRILAEAPLALAAPATPLGSTAPPHGTRNDFVSELQQERSLSDPKGSVAVLFRTHATVLRNTSAAVACLTAAYLLTHEEAYAIRAGAHLHAWFIAPESRMNPSGKLAGCEQGGHTGTMAGIADLVPLAEIARASSFLVDSQALRVQELAILNSWFRDLGAWLDNDRIAGMARDAKDHRASAWLLIRSAMARAVHDEKALAENRKRFRTPTLRNQINALGVFTQEVATANPFRNTLFNFDLLTGACQLLASPFDLLWDYELPDGPGMRSVAAYLFPSIQTPSKWPWIADAEHFRQLPGPRPGLLFTGRAYDRPDYVDVWRKLSTQPVPEEIAESFPIREPLLWTARAAHGL
jgi:hypothetical protein